MRNTSTVAQLVIAENSLAKECKQIFLPEDAITREFCVAYKVKLVMSWNTEFHAIKIPQGKECLICTFLVETHGHSKKCPNKELFH